MSLVDIVDPRGVVLAAEARTAARRRRPEKRAAPGQGEQYEYYRDYRIANAEEIARGKAQWAKDNAEWIRRYKRQWIRNKRAKRGSRLPRGEAVHNAKLTAAKVLDIRARSASGATLAALAAEYGIASSAVWKIVNRKMWAHVQAGADGAA